MRLYTIMIRIGTQTRATSQNAPDAGSLDLDQHLPGFQRRRLRQFEKRHVVAERLDAGGSQAHARTIARCGSPWLAPTGGREIRTQLLICAATRRQALGSRAVG